MNFIPSSSGPLSCSSVEPRSAGAFRRARNIALTAFVLLSASCAINGPMDGDPDALREDEIDSTAQELGPPFTIDPRKSIIVTDTDIVSSFSLKDVLQQLITQAGVPGLTPLTVFKQFMDTGRQKPSLGLGPHCDDVVVPGSTGSINGWPVLCPRNGSEADHDPFATPPDDNSYMAVALSNRFDLAPPDGANCGEYRVVFAKRSGITNGLNRNFIIFEARLPNPSPSLGRQGCHPVVEFWQNLSDPAKTPATRATELHNFYFNGLTGFEPVIHIDHYNPNGAPNSGTIRINEFLRDQAIVDAWSLREFRLTHTSGTSSSLLIVPTSVNDNPTGALFDPTFSDSRATTFRGTYFPSVVEGLASSGDINRFAYSALVPSALGAGESLMIPTDNNYLAKFGTGSSTLRTSIQTKLTAIGSPLTPDQIVGRAQHLSCAGCHEPWTRATARRRPLTSACPHRRLQRWSSRTPPSKRRPSRTTPRGRGSSSRRPSLTCSSRSASRC